MKKTQVFCDNCGSEIKGNHAESLCVSFEKGNGSIDFAITNIGSSGEMFSADICSECVIAKISKLAKVKG